MGEETVTALVARHLLVHPWGQPICPAVDKTSAAREIGRVIGNRAPDPRTDR
jgi:hypothetical protein